MSTLMEDEIKRWTARRETALVLEIIQGKTTVAEASRAHDLPPSETEVWVEDGKKGMENALRANPQDVREQYEKQLKDLQDAYGEAMLELRGRKICSPCWARTRSDRDDPPGTPGRRLHRPDQPAVSAVRSATEDRLLPSVTQATGVAGTVHSADQTDDRGESVLWIPHCRLRAEFQQEHRTAYFPVDALAGEEAAGRLPPASKGNAVTSFSAQ